MTITRLWQGGAEGGTREEFDTINDGTYFYAQSGTSYTGDYSFRVQGYSGIGITLPYGSLLVPATRQLRAGWWYQGSSSEQSYGGIFTVNQNNGTHIAGLESSGQGASWIMAIDIGGATQDSAPGLNQSTWYHIGVDLKIDSSAGWFYFYKDGSLVLSFDGNTGDVDIRIIRIGHVYDDDQNGNEYFDDIYIDDTTGEASPTAPYIKRFYPLNVNGDGTYSQWTPKPSGTVHYTMVDERPLDNDTTYLEAVTGSLLDSFDMTTFTLDTNENIIAMIPFVFAKRGSTTEQMSLGTRSSGTNLIGTAQDLSSNYDYVWERQETGSLGFEWNQSYMDSVEVIINSTGTY